MTFKGLLNETMSSNFQTSIKEKTTKINNSSRNHQIDPFIKYATTLYNEVPKPIQETEKCYYPVVPRLKRYLFDKTLVRPPSN